MLQSWKTLQNKNQMNQTPETNQEKVKGEDLTMTETSKEHQHCAELMGNRIIWN